jgi:hypothetical protein
MLLPSTRGVGNHQAVPRVEATEMFLSKRAGRFCQLGGAFSSVEWRLLLTSAAAAGHPPWGRSR